MNRYALAAIASLCIAAPAPARVVLESSAFTETGSQVQSGKVRLLSAGGQAVIGSAREQGVSLKAGFLYALAPHPRSSSTGDNPPKSALLFPKGFCSVSGGPVIVLGAVSGLGLSGWTLEAAPGRNAASGFATVASGEGEVSSAALGAWNAGASSGWQTLRLTATGDGGTSTSSADVYVGDPTTAFTGNGTLVWPEVAKRLIKPCK